MEAPARMSPGAGAVRSCINCAKAKAKCVKNAGEPVCHRCDRLNKECNVREPVQRKRRSAKTNRAAQLESLEHKLENLVNALSSSKSSVANEHGQPSPISHVSVSLPSTTQTPIAPTISDSCGKDDANLMCEIENNMSEAGNEEARPMPRQDCNDVCVSAAEAEILLNRFRKHMAPSYPFVVLPDDWTSCKLFTEKPFLCKVIHTVACYHDLAKQRELVQEVLKDLANRCLLNNEKSIDLLQGLIVFAAWYHPHIFARPQYNNILQMAQALVIDLGLNKQPQLWDRSKVQGAGPRLQCGVLHTPKPRLDGHRALLGLFFNISVNSASFKKSEPLKYSKAMDDGLAAIQEANECESDKLLVDMVKLQRFCESAYIAELSTSSIPGASSFYLKALLADLQRIKLSLNPRSWQNRVIRMLYHNGEIWAYELSLSDMSEGPTTLEASFGRLENLYGCLRACGLVFDEHLLIQPSEYLCLNFMMFGYFTHALIMLSKICAVEIDGWDPQHMQGGVNFGHTVDRAAELLDQASTALVDGQQVSSDWTSAWARKLRWLKGANPLGNVCAPDTSELHETMATMVRQPGVNGAQQPTPPDDPLSGDFFGYLDDNFWQDFMRDPDFGYLDIPMQ